MLAKCKIVANSFGTNRPLQPKIQSPPRDNKATGHRSRHRSGAGLQTAPIAMGLWNLSMVNKARLQRSAWDSYPLAQTACNRESLALPSGQDPTASRSPGRNTVAHALSIVVACPSGPLPQVRLLIGATASLSKNCDLVLRVQRRSRPHQLLQKGL